MTSSQFTISVEGKWNEEIYLLLQRELEKGGLKPTITKREGMFEVCLKGKTKLVEQQQKILKAKIKGMWIVLKPMGITMSVSEVT